MQTDQRRRPVPGRRLGTDRRWIIDLTYAGPDRRTGVDRRYGVSRRAAS